MYDRTPAVEIDQIFGEEAKLHRWHLLWIDHLEQQIAHRPDHPGSDGDLDRYREAAHRYATGDEGYRLDWRRDIVKAEIQTRHDVQAALTVFNQRADAHTAHHGLTSHDIVETANQIAIGLAWQQITTRARRLMYELAVAADNTRRIRMLARTHGQPAQATTYGYRIATIIDTLIHWHDRAGCWIENHPQRPAAGAVGTSADLARVVGGANGLWGYHANTSAAKADAPFALATRQILHRSHDLHTAALLVELATIADTWAKDRRLEAMLGLGNEMHGTQQVGSSAMPHKRNPVQSERICSLVDVSRGYLTTAANLASAEWLEGDVSGSAGRRHWIHGLFRVTDQIVTNWIEANGRFIPDTAAIEAEFDRHDIECYSGAALFELIELGVPRETAHKIVGDAAATAGIGLDDGSDAFYDFQERIRVGMIQAGYKSDSDLQTRFGSWSLALEFAEKATARVILNARVMAGRDD